MIWYYSAIYTALMIKEPCLTLDHDTDYFFNRNYNQSLLVEHSQYDVLCGKYSNLSETGRKRVKTV
jgi:hypothetical protein